MKRYMMVAMALLLVIEGILPFLNPRGFKEALLMVSRADDRIVWVAGWRLDERARITPATGQVLHLRFTKRSG